MVCNALLCSAVQTRTCSSIRAPCSLALHGTLCRQSSASRSNRVVAFSGDSAVSTGSQSLESSTEEMTQASSSEAFYNCVNILLGCGVLTIPYALREAGWAAFGVLGLMALSTNYTGKVLIKLQEYYLRHPEIEPDPGHTYKLQQGTLATYEDIAEMAYGSKGRDFISLVLYTELLGTCALFLILQKDHVKLLLESSGVGVQMGDTLLLSLALAVVMPTVWVGNVSALSYVGAAGAVSAGAIACLLGFLYVTPHAPVATELAHVQSLPFTFGIMAFVFAGHAVFPAIYNSIRAEERHHFREVIDKSFLTAVLVCGLIGFTGYSVFGSSALEEVTLNLPAGWIQVLAFGLVLISPFAKFALTLEPVAQGIDTAVDRVAEGYVPRSMRKRATRTGLALSTLLLAAKVPFFGIFMSVLGAFLTLTVSVLFPCAANLKVYGEEMESSEKSLNVFILAIGACATIAGTVAALQPLRGGHLGAEDASMISDAVVIAQNHESVFKRVICSSLCRVV